MLRQASRSSLERFSIPLSFAVLALVVGRSLLGAQEEPPANAPYLNPALPIGQRVDDLISRMTLEEKISQMRDEAAAIPRLGVPDYVWWNEAAHGVAGAGYSTVFPQVIGLAATWDAPLMHQIGETVSTEGRAKYHEAIREGRHEWFYGLTFWAPNINIFRDPRWGRGQETYGEDPFLTGRLATAFVTGMQGDDPDYIKVVSTPKHYAVHSGPEPLRHSFNVDVTPYDLEDTYLPAFRATVVEGNAESIMCAYNSIDGAPACANVPLMQDILKDAWGFDGYVVSDCGATSNAAAAPSASWRRRSKKASSRRPRSTPRSSGFLPPDSGWACSIRPIRTPTGASPTRPSTRSSTARSRCGPREKRWYSSRTMACCRCRGSRDGSR
jgi:beta-glucosidase-like glycosyl hydrolase